MSSHVTRIGFWIHFGFMTYRKCAFLLQKSTDQLSAFQHAPACDKQGENVRAANTRYSKGAVVMPDVFLQSVIAGHLFPYKPNM